ncbi:hypothetical protein RI367_000178 [Sorochytrium milnesiophthora]
MSTNSAINSHRNKASILSRITQDWLTPLIRAGYRRPLEMENLPALSPEYTASRVHHELKQCWLKELKKAWRKSVRGGQHAHPHLARALVRAFGRQWYISAVYKIIGDGANMATPLVIRSLIDLIKDYASATPPSLSRGLGLAVLLFVLQVVASLATQAFWNSAQMAGLKARTALTSVVCRKTLHLSHAARQQWNTGTVMNIVSTDLARIEQAFPYTHLAWTSLLQVLVGSVLLLYFVGASAWAGLGVFVLFLPIQIKGMALVAVLRRKAQLISDKRVRLTSELLQNMKLVKMLTWENSLLNRVRDLRERELRLSRRMAMWKACVVGLAQAVPGLGIFMVFVSMGNDLEAGMVFGALALFNLIRLPMWQLPQSLSYVMDAQVALQRVEALLVAQEVTSLPTVVDDSEYALQIDSACFSWDVDTNDDTESISSECSPSLYERTVLRDITLKIPHGKLVAVVGRVGSCKTSLLNGIIGEMKRTAGSVKLSGTVAYCSQSAWIQNATLLDNILFGRPMNRSRYDVVIRNACLERDLQQLPDGELTEIGEKGINVSGGQKARINLARALYSDPDIYLLDDVLAAVDAHVGARLFNDCIKGHLQGKTRILVTHALSYVSQCDYVIVMDNGRIKEMGTFDECMAQDGHFADMMQPLESTSDGDLSLLSSSKHSKSDRSSDSDSIVSKHTEYAIDTPPSKPRVLMVAEERAVGAVRSHVYRVRVANDLWLVWWTSASLPMHSPRDYMFGYLYFAIAQTVLLVVSGALFSVVGITGARAMHDAALQRIMCAPLSFFEQTPLGRILSRFSKDCDVVTNTLYDSYRTFARNLVVALSSICMVCVVTPLLTVPLVVIAVLYFYVQRFYRATSRELKRLESLSRSPLYAQLSEAMTGITTIRAYRKEAAFAHRKDQLIDTNNRPYYLQVTAPRWLAIRLEFCSALLVTGVAVLGVVAGRNVSAALLGVALSNALQITTTLNVCVRQGSEAESQMNAVERLDYYACFTPQEVLSMAKTVQLSPEWPSLGEISIQGLTMAYRDLPPALRNINVRIPSGARVGIVGRTGAGKSSIVTALLRLVEATEGKILIDDIDISKIGLRDLRSRIAIIPQDPVLFSGTIRNNLDRFSEYEDAQLWDRLQRAGLYDTVASSDDKLDMVVAENGENLSLGERCCLCLARAMMGNRKILIMDEATASVDLATEERIQHSLRRDFAGVTILTIAHRLNTVIDYDYILSLDAGQVVEFDHPHVLVNRPGSLFASLVDETGPANAQMLRSLAATAAAISADE